jgi:hypothetical protein
MRTFMYVYMCAFVVIGYPVLSFKCARVPVVKDVKQNGVKGLKEMMNV